MIESAYQVVIHIDWTHLRRILRLEKTPRLPVIIFDAA